MQNYEDIRFFLNIFFPIFFITLAMLMCYSKWSNRPRCVEKKFTYVVTAYMGGNKSFGNSYVVVATSDPTIAENAAKIEETSTLQKYKCEIVRFDGFIKDIYRKV